MKKDVTMLITEHKELSEKVMKLKLFLNGENGVNVFTDIENNKTQKAIISNMIQFANLCMQLHTMEQYLGILDTKLDTEGIYFQNGQYTRISFQPVIEENNTQDKANQLSENEC